MSGDRWGLAGEAIQARVERWLAEPLPDFPERRLNPDEKWLASSSMQKAVRRGRVDVALSMACALMQLEPAYLVRRLAVVALEDVALGNLDAAEAAIWAMQHAAWRRRVGGTALVVLTLVERLASGVKDRSGCDAIVAAGFDPQRAAEREWAAQATASQLVEAIATSPDPISRTVFAWQLAGPDRGRSGGLKPGKARPDFNALLSASEHLGTPERVRTLTRAAWRRGVGALPVGLLVTSAMAEAGTWIEPNEYEQREPIAGWPAEALDVHTREGRRALAYLAKAAPTLKKLLLAGGVSGNRVVEVLIELLWITETDACDRRLVFAGSAELRQQARRWAGLRWCGLRDELHEPAITMMRVNSALLDHARRRVLGAVPAGGGPREVVPRVVRELLGRGPVA